MITNQLQILIKKGWTTLINHVFLIGCHWVWYVRKVAVWAGRWPKKPGFPQMPRSCFLYRFLLKLWLIRDESNSRLFIDNHLRPFAAYDFPTTWDIKNPFWHNSICLNFVSVSYRSYDMVFKMGDDSSEWAFLVILCVIYS